MVLLRQAGIGRCEKGVDRIWGFDAILGHPTRTSACEGSIGIKIPQRPTATAASIVGPGTRKRFIVISLFYLNGQSAPNRRTTRRTANADDIREAAISVFQNALFARRQRSEERRVGKEC